MKLIFFSVLFVAMTTYAQQLDTVFYSTGEIKRIKEFDKNGKQTGVTKSFSKSGLLVMTNSYKNGKPDGLSVTFYETKAKKYERLYEKGKLNGWSTQWDTLGYPTDSTFFEEDQRKERYLFYDRARQVRKHEYYAYPAGKRLLAMEDTYNRDGKIISQVRNGNGVSHIITNTNDYKGIALYQNGESDALNDFIAKETNDSRHARKPIPKSAIIPWDPEKYGTITIK